MELQWQTIAGIFGVLEFLGHYNFWGTEYSYNIYDNGTNMYWETTYILTLGNSIILLVLHVIRYMCDICSVYNFPSFI